MEAHELKQADTNVFGSSTSDPYCTITGIVYIAHFVWNNDELSVQCLMLDSV